MIRLVGEVETNGFLADLTKVHCAVLKDGDTREGRSYADQPDHEPIENALDRIM
jgi:hypothetical protein